MNNQLEICFAPPAFIYNDGGREAAGFKGSAGDCVTRSIAIAAGLPYLEVYNALFEAAKQYAETHRTKLAKEIRKKGASPRNGMHRFIYEPYLFSLGFKWVPTMQIGQGCKVHLKADELPAGKLIVSVSRHLCAVINGTIYDTYNASRDGTRCVYGYYIKE